MNVNADTGRVPKRAFSVVQSVLAQVRAANRYRDRSTADGEGEDYRHHARGGIWNDRDGRAAYGIAKGDAADLRRELRAIGAKVTADEADALLLQAEMGYLKAMSPRTQEQERTKMQRRREAARANGLCIICCARPQPAGRVTCQECRDRVTTTRRLLKGVD